MNPIRVLLVIEVRLIANLFASVLEDEPDMEIAGFVFTEEDALEFVQAGTWMLHWSVQGCRTRIPSSLRVRSWNIHLPQRCSSGAFGREST